MKKAYLQDQVDVGEAMKELLYFCRLSLSAEKSSPLRLGKYFLIPDSWQPTNSRGW
jgi:hypothetical protein